MIYANINLFIGEKESICDRQITLYRGDKNVQIRFILKDNRFTVVENTYAQLIINRPNAASLFTECSKIEKDEVILTISEDMIDELKEIGTYQFQIRLYDDDMNARVTLPPCYSGLIIERPIAAEGESLINLARINDAIATYSDDKYDIFDDDNLYIKTEWEDGDLISDKRMNKIEEAIYELSGKDTGSGASGAYISTTTSGDVMVQTDTDFIFDIDFYSPNLGQGTIKVFVNDTEVVTQKIIQGTTDITVPSDVFTKGNNTTVAYVIDRTGNMSNSLTFYVRYGGTELFPSFDPYTAYDYGSNVRYYFTASALDTSRELTLYMNIDNLLAGTVACSSDTRSFYTFSNKLSVGVHKCIAWVSDGETESNKHEFNLIILDETSLVVASDTSYLESEEGESLSIDYKVYMKNNDTFTVNVYIDNELVSTGACGLDFNYYKTSSLLEGQHTVKIEVIDKTGVYSDYVECLVEITPSVYTMKVPVKAGSMFIASAQNRTNADSNPDKWVGVDQDNTQITANLYDFAFDSNDGWGNDLLTIDGSANVVVPVKPLANNAKYGFTLDIAFVTKPIGVENAEVLTLWDYSKDCGVKITQEEAIIKSASGQICNLYFSENELVSVIFVVDRNEKMAKIYLNGVMCEAFALSDYENNGIQYLEDFTVDSYVYLNKFGGYAQIDRLAIYEIALGSSEILNNFISLKKTKQEQQTLENFQNGDTLPTLTIYCDFSGLGKDDKKPCDIYYNSPDPILYGESFALAGKTSLLQYQGTSSMAYPIKNYRLNLRDKNGEKWKYNPYSSGQPEARFTLKADFMSSGHWQNTGLAKWINDNLYNYNVNDEKSMNPSKWYDVQNDIPMSAHRETINGFPCRLILVNDGNTPLNAGQYEPTPGNTKDMGVFNFNNDKDNTDTLGFNSDIFPYCASYEVTANSDTSAGAFISYKGDGTREDEEAYYLQSFELRYPDADDVGDAWGIYDVDGDSSMGLKRVVDWVDNCTDEEFVRDFEQYFHKQYTLRYYLLVIVLGMVDNLGKNMMFDTFDHKIWMPRFYDMDTICSYDNTGQIKFDVDIEMEQGYWNTSASRLWTKIRDLMHDELVEVYKDMRANGMSYESFMRYFYNEQIAQIPQKYYNMDADVKYLPFADAYIGKAHGDGYEHLKRWLKRRLIFTDSLYDYAPSYNNDILTIRANTTEPMTLELETYTPVYQHLSWYNGQMDKKKIDGKISVTFTGTAQAATDQEVLIYGGSNIKSIKGISSTNPSQLLIGAATRLVELDASGCTLLSDINSNGGNLLPHTYLTKLNLSGCTAMPGTLNMMNSRLLQHIDISESGFSSVSFPSVSKNIRSMSFRDCKNLSSIDFKNIDTKNVTNMAYMFDGCNALTSLDLSNFDTNNVTNMYAMFRYNNNLTSLDLSNFDTSNVKDMSYIFYNCNALTSLDVSNFDTTNVTSMVNMFSGCNKLTSLDVSGFVTTNVNDMNNMFQNCSALTSLDVSNFDTTNVTGMHAMFSACSSITSLDVSGFDTANVNDISSMFYGCSALTSLDVSNFDTKNVEYMYSMFTGCNALTSLDVSNFDTTKVTDMNYMFTNCNKLTSLDVSGFDTSNVTTMNGMFYYCYALTTLTANNMIHTNPKLFTDAINNGIILELIAKNWKFNGENVRLNELFRDNTTLQKLDLSDWDTSNVTSMYAMFNGCTALTSLDISNFDTTNVTGMAVMFQNCNKLTSLDVSGFDTSNVASMPNMFYGCNALTSLDVNNFDTTKVTNMSAMFFGCNALTSLDLSNFDTKNVTNMASMFSGCNKLTSLDVSNFNTKNVKTMSCVFRSCKALTSLDLSNFDTANVTDMSYMFYGCNALASLDVSNFDTKNVTSMESMFAYCNKPTSLDVSNFDTKNVTNMSAMFLDCNKLTSLDVSGFDTSKVTNMAYMFSGCNKLTSLDVSGFDTSKVTNMTNMFANCTKLLSLKLLNSDKTTVERLVQLLPKTTKLSVVRGTVEIDETLVANDWEYRCVDPMWIAQYISSSSTLLPRFNSGFTSSNYTRTYDDIGNGQYLITLTRTGELRPIDISFSNKSQLLGVFELDTSNVTTMGGMFQNCGNLTFLDVSNFDTTNVTSMNSMFKGCNALTSLDVSNFDTTNVENMYAMFSGCNALTSLDLRNFNTTKVEDMTYMFADCKALTSLDISNFDTTNVTNMGLMFSGCRTLTSLDVSNFDTTNVTNMNGMFNECNALTSLDVSGFNTTNVENMYAMFYSCNALTSLDVSNFDTTNVTNMGLMFYGCSALTFLDVSNFDTTNVENMYAMFSGCNALTSLDLRNFNTTNVTSMNSMFKGCNALTSLDVNNFDTKKVTNMNAMFSGLTALTSLDLSNFDTSNVKDMSYIFYNCNALTSLDVSGFDTTNVTTMGLMFSGCRTLTSLDLSNFDTTNVTNMNGMFNACIALTSLDLRNFNTTNVENMYAMFYGCSALTSLDVSNFDTTNVTNMGLMFSGCKTLTSLDISNFDTKNVKDMGGMLGTCHSLMTLNVTGWPNNTYTQTAISSLPVGDDDKNEIHATVYFSVPSGWSIINPLVFLIYTTNASGVMPTFNAEFSGYSVNETDNGDGTYRVKIASDDLSNLPTLISFKEKENLLTVDKINTSNVTNMHYMFQNCNALTSLDVSNFDTTNVDDMYCMFQNCSTLTSLDVSGFDTKNVKSMGYMFQNCKALTSLDVSNFDTKNVTNMASMFSGCNKLTSLDVSGFDTSKVTNIACIFENCKALTSLDLSNFDTTNVKDMTYMFYSCNALTSLDVSGFDTKNVTSMYAMFYQCSALTSLDVSNFDTKNVTVMGEIFSGCKAITSLNVTGWPNNTYTQTAISSLPKGDDAKNEVYASSYFTIPSGWVLIYINPYDILIYTSKASGVVPSFNSGYTGYSKEETDNGDGTYTTHIRTNDLEVLPTTISFNGKSNLLTVDKINTSNITSMRSMFKGCNALTSLDVSNFYTSKVTDMYEMFYQCNALTSLDVSGFDTTNVMNMGYMFYYCNALTSLDLSNFDTANVTSMDSMFAYCNKLTSLDVSNFNTTNVTNMNSMFYNCSALTSLDVTNFDTKNVKSMYGMFYGGDKLTSLDLSNFNTSNVTTMESMFDSCYVLTSLDLSIFDTKKVTSMANMFKSCRAITSLDLSGFDTSNVTSMANMFQNCRALTSLDLSNFDTTNVTNMYAMFHNCYALTSLDVSNFNTSNVFNMRSMFQNCRALTSLDLSNFDTSKVTSTDYTFNGCNDLMSLNVIGWPNNTYTQTAISSLPVGNDAKNEIYASVSFTVPSGWSLINNASMTMNLRQTDLYNLTDEEIAALVDAGWTIG